MSLLILFFVFLFIPSGFGEKIRYGEYCSTSPSHVVECSDPKAECVTSTETRYGSCECPKTYHSIQLRDKSDRIVKTECIKPRKSIYKPCFNSMQCQIEDQYTICVREKNRKPSCYCRELDGYYLGFETDGCLTNVIKETDLSRWSTSSYIMICILFWLFALYIMHNFARISFYLRGIWGLRRGRRSESSSGPSVLTTPLHTISSDPPPPPPPSPPSPPSPPPRMVPKQQMPPVAQLEPKRSPELTDVCSLVSSVSIPMTSPQCQNEPTFTQDPIPLRDPDLQESIPSSLQGTTPMSSFDLSPSSYDPLNAYANVDTPTSSQVPGPSSWQAPGRPLSQLPERSVSQGPAPSYPKRPGSSYSLGPGRSVSQGPGQSYSREPKPSSSQEVGPLVSQEVSPLVSQQLGPKSSIESGSSDSQGPGPSGPQKPKPKPSISQDPGPSSSGSGSSTFYEDAVSRVSTATPPSPRSSSSS